MKNYFEKLINRVAGDPASISLPQRTYNLVIAASILIATSGWLVNALFVGIIEVIPLVTLLILLLVYLYYLSIKRNHYRLPAIILIIFSIFILLPAIWFVVNGLAGGMHIYFLNLAIFIAMVIQRKRVRFLLSLLLVGMFLMLVYKQHYFPMYHAIPDITSKQHLVSIVNNITGVITTITLMYMLITSYSIEHRRVLEYSTTIEKQKKQLQKQNRELARLYRQASHDASHDGLTGLPNRGHFLTQLEGRIRSQRSNDSAFYLFFMDFDGFKDVNDTLGHEAGDALLIEATGRIQSLIRATDILARIGGDEFTLLVPEVSRQQAVSVAERVIESVSIPYEVGGSIGSVTVSIGISVFPDDSSSAEELMRQADTAMYAAKEKGKNRYIFAADVGVDSIFS